MDYLFKLIVLFSLSFPSYSAYSAGNAWVSKWVDGPAPATFERTPTAMRTYVNLPQYGGHAQWTLPSTPPAASVGSYIAPVSTATTPKIATSVKIPVGAAAGAVATATLTAVIPKTALAKAAVAMMRANPYVSAAITFGWLASAGYHYFSDSDTWTALAPTSVSTPTCASIGGVGNVVFQGTTKYTVIPHWSVGGSCASELGSGAVFVDNCTAAPVYTYNSSGYFPVECSVPNQVNTPYVVQHSQVESGLSLKPVAGSSDTGPLFDSVINEEVANGFNPDTDGAVPSLSGSTSPINGPSSTTTSPTGTVTKTTTTYSPTYNNNYVDVTETTTNAVTDNNNVTTTTTTTGPANTPPPQQQTQTDCDKYPDSIGCAKFGDAGVPDVVQTVNVSASLNPTSLGSGSCPSPNVVNLSSGKTVTFSYQPECDLATGIAPLMIALAWLAAGMLVLSPVRG